MPFSSFNLHNDILKAISAEGFTAPTPIQTQAIPLIMTGKNFRMSAQTGSGKTAAFILPILQKIVSNPNSARKGPRVLILVPTRELATQVSVEIVKFSKFLPFIRTVCIYGGTPYPIQNRQLSRPYDILVATPGRLIDHLERNRINLSQVETLILDEADRMLDMGFIEPVEDIAAQTPATRQTLLFSATMGKNILSLSKKLMPESLELSITSAQTKHDHIEQRLYYVDDLSHKYRVLKSLLQDPGINQAIVFTSTKRFADTLALELRSHGCSATALHGDMNQNQRNRAILRLRKGDVDVLVATDVAARGIDVNTISHVFNFDLPNNSEDYIHRIGRTGRAGAQGIALSFVSSKDRQLVSQIEKYTGHKIALHTVPGLEPSFKSSSEPKRNRFNPRDRRNRFSRRRP